MDYVMEQDFKLLLLVRLERTSIQAQIINGAHFRKKVIIPRAWVLYVDRMEEQATSGISRRWRKKRRSIFSGLRTGQYQFDASFRFPDIKVSMISLILTEILERSIFIITIWVLTELTNSRSRFFGRYPSGRVNVPYTPQSVKATSICVTGHRQQAIIQNVYCQNEQPDNNQRQTNFANTIHNKSKLLSRTIVISQQSKQYKLEGDRSSLT
ncbi:hypothetical protein Tco_0370467 [Tanacetum coccineum]